MANVAYYKKCADAVLGEGETNVFIQQYPNHQPLPNNSRIVFKIGENKELTIHNDEMGVNINYQGNGRLVILPRVSNSVNVTSVLID